MGKFLKYEDSNFRTFVIDTTAGTIVRPKRRITKEDLLAAVIKVDGEEVVLVSAIDNGTTITASGIIDGEVSQLVYTLATDAFALGETSLTNVMIDEFGREHVTLD
jgi:hypothetical protein